jgi:hypothetical protein
LKISKFPCKTSFLIHEQNNSIWKQLNFLQKEFDQKRFKISKCPCKMSFLISEQTNSSNLGNNCIFLKKNLIRKSWKFQDFHAKRHFWFLSKLTVSGKNWIFLQKSLIGRGSKFWIFIAKPHFWFLSKLQTVFGEKWIFFEKSLTRKGWKSWNFHAKRHFWFMSKQEYMEKTAFSLKRVWSEKAHNFEISMQNVISDPWAN